MTKKKRKKTNGLKTKLRRNVTGCREGTEQAVRADQLLLLLSVPVLSLLLSISPYFIPIPIQAYVHPLSTFFETLMALDGWIQYNDQCNVFIMRGVFQINLLHQSCHLILFDINSRTADSPVHLN